MRRISRGFFRVLPELFRARSSATVTAFVMKELQYSMEKALEFVHERRPIILPNVGFMDQLREYEGILKAR